MLPSVSTSLRAKSLKIQRKEGKYSESSSGSSAF